MQDCIISTNTFTYPASTYRLHLAVWIWIKSVTHMFVFVVIFITIMATLFYFQIIICIPDTEARSAHGRLQMCLPKAPSMSTLPYCSEAEQHHRKLPLFCLLMIPEKPQERGMKTSAWNRPRTCMNASHIYAYAYMPTQNDRNFCVCFDLFRSSVSFTFFIFSVVTDEESSRVMLRKVAKRWMLNLWLLGYDCYWTTKWRISSTTTIITNIISYHFSWSKSSL